jgi:short-subunit dehydrogenase
MGHIGYPPGLQGYVSLFIPSSVHLSNQTDSGQAAVQKMVAQKVQGKIIFVSSLLGYASFAGYTNYSPGKYALRGQSSSFLHFPLTGSSMDMS